MKFELLTDHYAADRILPAGLIVDFDDPTYGYKTRKGYAPPSLHMRPLDEEARKAYVDRHPDQEDSPVLDPVERIPIRTPYSNVIKSSAPGDTDLPGVSDGGGRLVPSKEVADSHDAEELATVDVGEPIGRMNADKAALPDVANVPTLVTERKVREAEIKDDLSKAADAKREEALAASGLEPAKDDKVLAPTPQPASTPPKVGTLGTQPDKKGA